MNFNDQNWPCRRRRIHARSADVSADSPSMRSPGRYIGGAPINCAPTGHYQCCLLNFIIGRLHDTSAPTVFPGIIEFTTNTPTNKRGLLVVFRHRVGEVSGVLHHWLNLWPYQKARTQRLTPDALRQPLDDRCRLPKRGARLPLLSPGLIQASQRRLNLPLFSWQAEVCGQLGGLAQVVDGLLSVHLPRGQGCQRAQVGQEEAPIGPQTFPQSVYFCSRLAFITPTQ